MLNTISHSEVESWLVTTQKIVENLGSAGLNFSTNSRDPSSSLPYQPDVYYKDKGIVVGKYVIPLGHRPMTAKLVRCFFDDSEQYFSKDELLEKVYNVTLNDLSPRMKHSLYQSLIKLISRSRAFLHQACRVQGAYKDIEWFQFDRNKRKWSITNLIQV